MRYVSRTLAGVLALGFVAGLNLSPAFAQTEVEPSNSPMNTTVPPRGAVRPSPADRNVGPDSTVGGGRPNDLGNADSGLPRTPGAPSTSGDGSTGGH